MSWRFIGDLSKNPYLFRNADNTVNNELIDNFINQIPDTMLPQLKQLVKIVFLSIRNNIRIEKMQNILQSVKIPSTPKDAETIYKEKITYTLINTLYNDNDVIGIKEVIVLARRRASRRRAVKRSSSRRKSTRSTRRKSTRKRR